MANCLIALGSNLGDRAAAIQAALADLDALPDTQLLRQSRNYSFPSVGGAPGQPDFMNAAAMVQTSLAPLALFQQLVQIEIRHGRQRGERWAARTLDIDLLLYDDQVIDTPALVVPHPRMSFRRFVLEPAAEVAPDMFHPIIGRTISQLAFHLDRARDWAAIVSPSLADRRELCELATTRFGAKMLDPQITHVSEIDDLLPAAITTWLALPTSRHQIEGCASISPDVLRKRPASTLPKLTILVDPPPDAQGIEPSIDWPTLRQQRGRGPTLWIRTTDPAEAACELSAAIESVWPHLVRSGDTRIE